MRLPCALVVVLLIGCSSKKVEVLPKTLVEEYRARLEPLQAKIEKLAATLSPDVELTPPAKLDPPAVFKTDGYGSVVKDANTIVLMYDWLSDPVGKHDAAKLPPAALYFALYWLKTPPSGDGGSNAPMHQTLEQAANTRYAIVLRDQGEVAPRIIDEKTFAPGSATARLYVYDLVADKLIGAQKIVATTPDKVKFTYSSSSDENARAERALLDSIKTDREVKLNKALQALGDAKLDH